MPEIIPQTYAELLTEIKSRIRTAQYAAPKALNKELICLYWDIGKMIVEYEPAQSESPIGVAKYELVSTLPENLRRQLPTPEQINTLLQGID